MVGYMPTVTSSGIIYNTDSSTGSIATNNGVTIRSQYIQIPTATSNTYPTAWTEGSSTTAYSYEIQYGEYATLDMPTTWQYSPLGGYTLRVCRANETTWVYDQPWTVPKTPKERLREILDSRMAPGILSSCKPLGYAKDIREVRARETLQRVLGEEKFRDFVRRGHVTVRAKSGLVYQIFPGHEITKVYDRGVMTERLCVVLTGEFPPTDSLIMRYLMILNNEEQFRSYAIKHSVQKPQVYTKPEDQRSLAEIFRDLKKVA